MSNTFHRSDSISLTSFCGAGILVDTEKSLRCLQITVEQNPHAGQNDGSTKNVQLTSSQVGELIKGLKRWKSTEPTGGM